MASAHHPKRIEPTQGQRSVWDFPRPPAIEAEPRGVTVELNGVVIASTERAKRVLETSLAPSYYIPPEDIDMSKLRKTPGVKTFCEWKGYPTYYDVAADGASAEAAAFSYDNPTESFREIAGWVSFYPGKVICRVGGDVAEPQAGGFYSGWITPDVVGPFKGEPGTEGW